MIGVLRPGRRFDIVYADDPFGMADFPITCTILGEPQVLPVAAQIVDGELVPWRSQRLVRVYTDPGGVRTLKLADIVMR